MRWHLVSGVWWRSAVRESPTITRSADRGQMRILMDWKMDVAMNFWMNAMMIALGMHVTRE